MAAVVMNLSDVRLGFTFSAGLIDYALNYTRAGNPAWLLPIGLGYALVYYGVFCFAIRRWNLATPGRERTEEASELLSQRGIAAPPSWQRSAEPIICAACQPALPACGFSSTIRNASTNPRFGALADAGRGVVGSSCHLPG